MFYQNGQVLMDFNRYMLIGRPPHTPRADNLAVCTPEQIDALDMIQELAEKYQLVLDMQPGDMTYTNNWAILHSREAFHDDAEHSRYLVRLWLKNEKLAWELPECLRCGNEALFYNENVVPRWNIVPQPRIRFSISQTLGP